MWNVRKDLLTKRFGSLVVIDKATSKDGHARWTCRCDCGSITTTAGTKLRRGKSLRCTSCKLKLARLARTFNGTSRYTDKRSSSPRPAATKGISARSCGRPGKFNLPKRLDTPPRSSRGGKPVDPSRRRAKT